MMKITHKQVKEWLFLLPFFLYEDMVLSAIMLVLGFALLKYEKIDHAISELEWREYLFFIYMFHMMFGERDFAYVGFEPLFITEIVIFALAVSYARDLLKIRKTLFVYYLVVLIGLAFAFLYFPANQLDAIRDSFMLVYAIWVPIVYHVFRSEKHYDLFFVLLKLFIVLKAVSYFYEAVLILAGMRSLSFEGFRFGVGYIVPSLIVITIFLPLKYIDFKYKLVALVMIPAVFTMFHRSLFVGITLAILLMFAIGSNLTRRKIVTYGMISLTLMIAFLFYYNSVVDVNLFQILETKTSLEEGNINYRFLSWQHVLDKFYEHYILGFGVGRPLFFSQYNIFYSTVEMTYFQIRDLEGNAQPHNSYLNMLARFGVLLFPILMYAILKPLKKIPEFLNIKRKGGDHAYSKFLFLMAFLIIMYVWAFFNVVLEGPHHSFHFWLATGMILSFGRAGNFSKKYVRIRKTTPGS
ncbi:O-antigen ligase family protein [Rhodohalobacter sulfatireducens]|uniref:O-antigen ligase family protein n=1 Tax=Rhodohalobacter sulfatireducens TaxID=2911366 RepID=A0ABS9KJD0_9BACT|nr:O-antigen ligase family protein [Rhodohalobacter sulfatireducens]MCG2590957.1 O-antigen ligase family protein [Rhodohalobacter sulfatireducens]